MQGKEAKIGNVSFGDNLKREKVVQITVPRVMNQLNLRRLVTIRLAGKVGVHRRKVKTLKQSALYLTSKHNLTRRSCHLKFGVMKRRLTPKTIDALPPGVNKRYEVRDQLLPGLHLHVSGTGGKVFGVSIVSIGVPRADTPVAGEI